MITAAQWLLAHLNNVSDIRLKPNDDEGGRCVWVKSETRWRNLQLELIQAIQDHAWYLKTKMVNHPSIAAEHDNFVDIMPELQRAILVEYDEVPGNQGQGIGFIRYQSREYYFHNIPLNR